MDRGEIARTSKRWMAKTEGGREGGNSTIWHNINRRCWRVCVCVCVRACIVVNPSDQSDRDVYILLIIFDWILNFQQDNPYGWTPHAMNSATLDIYLKMDHIGKHSHTYLYIRTTFYRKRHLSSSIDVMFILLKHYELYLYNIFLLTMRTSLGINKCLAVLLSRTTKI